jgi:hypothetical protein
MRHLSKIVGSRVSRRFHSEWLTRRRIEGLEPRSMAAPLFIAIQPFGDSDGNVMASSSSSVYNAQQNILISQSNTVPGPGGATASSAVSGTVVPGRIIDMQGDRGPVRVTATEQGIASTTLGAPIPGGDTSAQVQILASHQHIDTVTADANGPYSVVGFPNWGQGTHVQSLPSGSSSTPYDLNWNITSQATLSWSFQANMPPSSDARFAEFAQMGLVNSFADVHINDGSPGLWIMPHGVAPGNSNAAYAYDTNFGFGSPDHQSFGPFIMQFTVPSSEAVGVSYHSSLSSAPGQAGVVGSRQSPQFNNETAGSNDAFTWSFSMDLS